MKSTSEPLSDYEANTLADLDAFRRVKRMVQEGRLPANAFAAFAPTNSAQTTISSNPASVTNETPALRSVGVDSAVSDALKSFNGQFTVANVLEKLRSSGGNFIDSSVRAALARMVPNHIRVATPGKGRRATIYRTLTADDF